MLAWITVALIGGIFVGGIVCMALPLAWWLRTRRRIRLGGVADGWVVALTPQASGPDPESYITVFQFDDRQGVSHRVSTRIARWPAAHAIGDRVRVAYDPASPEDAEIVSDPRSLVALALLGVALAAMALLLWWGIWIGAFVPGSA